MSFAYLELLDEGEGVWRVTLQRTPGNAIDQTMYREIAECFNHPDRYMADVRAIILTGAGKHFCTGNDLEEFSTMTPENGTERMWRVREGFFAIQDCPVPVIGAIQGTAIGSGLAVAAACDVIVASTKAKFGLPELSVGVMGGAAHLARIGPQHMVRLMFFTGEHLPAQTMVQMGAGLIIVEPEQLLDEALRIARKSASFSPTAVRLAKQVLNRVENMDLKTGYEFEQGFTVRMSGHPDAKEALRAVRERSTPHYRPLDQAWTLEA
ncbi:Enoyl-CoA hydratase/isomerase [Sphingobium chlorophenolicum L-1]|uniref:Enoyl-CoA hydratase/isomerase n=1 Tax=Sphingobium chlorophenolicum L-1 TaxID=690566 RepID=F6F3A3_SPHCR|nr:enoyl-CoA hydratase-related protein [Sphingobium chlorophenolicum]AEG50915.1 Enoyl-CoA hydratase/isomerase [Sphingobium chlorophenolicum L-1]